MFTTKDTKNTIRTGESGESTTKDTKNTIRTGESGESTTRDTIRTGKFEPVPAELDRIARATVDAIVRVHSALGPGLLESVYETCLAHELEKSGLSVQRQVVLPVVYDGVKLDAGLRLDLLVADQLIVEVKAADRMSPIFEAQLLTYLKLTGRRLGLLVNFNVTAVRNGIKRMVR